MLFLLLLGLAVGEPTAASVVDGRSTAQGEHLSTTTSPLLKLPTNTTTTTTTLIDHHNTMTTISATTTTTKPYDDEPPDCTHPDKNRLECWLWNLQVKIPSESFKDWITITVHDMVCSQFQLQTLESSTNQNTLTLTIGTVHAFCHGRYHSSGGIKGDVQAGVSEQQQQEEEDDEQQPQSPSPYTDTHHAVEVSFVLKPKAHGFLPGIFETKACTTHLKATNIHFSGSFSAKLIQAFRKPIGHYITQALQQQICPLLHSKLDPLVTQAIQRFDDAIQPYLPPDGSDNHNNHNQIPSPPVVTNEKVDQIGSLRQQPEQRQLGPKQNLSSNSTSTSVPISNWNLVHWGLRFLNDQLANHLQQGWFFSNHDRFCPSEDCVNMFRGLSGWVVSIFGESIRLPVPKYLHNVSIPSLPYNAKASVSLSELHVQGLDLLDSLQLLEPVDDDDDDDKDHNGTLVSTVSTEQGFFVRIPVTLVIQLDQSVDDGDVDTVATTLTEIFDLSLNITQVETIVESLLQVIDWDTTSVWQVVDAVQTFVDTQNLDDLGCLIRTIDQVTLTDWIAKVAIESIQLTRNPKFNRSSLEEDLDGVINSVLELATSQYSDLWTSLVQGLVQGPGRNAVNKLVTDWIASHAGSNACPDKPINPDVPHWLNFTKFQILKKMNRFFNDTRTRKTMNHYLECVGSLVEGLAKNQSNDVLLAGGEGHSRIAITNIQTNYWNTLEEFQLIEPQDCTSLESALKWGISQDQGTPPPQATVTVELARPKLNGTLHFTVFGSVEASMGTRLDYNLNLLENLTMARMLQQGQCVMIPAVEFRIMPESLLALGSVMGLNVSGIFNNEHVIEMSTFDYQDVVPDAVADMLDWSVEWVRRLTNRALEEWVVGSSDTCPGIIPRPGPPTPSDDDKSFWWEYPFLVWMVLVLIVVGQYGILLLAKPPKTEDDSADVEDETNELREPLIDDNQLDQIVQHTILEDYDKSFDQGVLNDMRELDQALLSDIMQDQMEDDRNLCILEEDEAYPNFAEQQNEQNPNPLFVESETPVLIRFLLPMMIVGTIILLFSSNVSTGASVDLSMQLGSKTIHLPGLFEFSLGNTVTELYKAGIYPLLFLVVVFSGIWPYAKLCLMMHAWLKQYQTVHKREEILRTLDALGKFSLVDTYVLVVMLVAFRFHLEASENLGLDVYVTPGYGFYAFLLATCLSLVLGHGMLYFHRRAQRTELSGSLIDESIFDHEFEVEANGPRRRLSRPFQVVLLSCCLVALVFLTLGFTKQSFTFEFGGLAGIALGDLNRSSYSLLSLGAAIPRSVENPMSFGVYFLQLAYYFYAVVTPVSCLVILMVLLVCPLPLSRQRSLLVAAEIANAWSAVEVFVLSIIAALLQISTFASFIIGDKCDLINRLTEDFMGNDDVPIGDAVCFTVQASVQPDCWCLVAGVLLYSSGVSLGLRFAHNALDERIQRLQSTSLPLRDHDDDLHDWTFASKIFSFSAGYILFDREGAYPDFQESEEEHGGD